MVQHVAIGATSLRRFETVLGEQRVAQAEAVAERLRARLDGRAIWNINSTAVGGGVAEMLPSLLAYSRAQNIDTRWVVIEAAPDFFRLTKRLHHALHGSGGDGRVLDEAARTVYEQQLRSNTLELCAEIGKGDVVLLHDPQTAGLAPALMRHGAHVIWRCHIGHDARGPEVEEGWAFLRPYLQEVPSLVFSRREYAPPFVDRKRITVIQPSIDAFAPKNQGMEPQTVRNILAHVGLICCPNRVDGDRSFSRLDGTPGRVERGADLVRLGRGPSQSTPLVVQVSRWDPLKDMVGVMHGFTRTMNGDAPANAELVLAGPKVTAVADDPEGPAVFDEVLRAWFELPRVARERVTLAMLPTNDVDENAAIVNALQRHATIVVQKSLHEGFGLTVTEAMWKGRAVVASRVGGIQDQIEDGISGVLVDDPRDLDGFADALRSILMDPERAEALGAAARERVRGQFLGLRHLLQYGALIERLLEP